MLVLTLHSPKKPSLDVKLAAFFKVFDLVDDQGHSVDLLNAPVAHLDKASDFGTKPAILT